MRTGTVIVGMVAWLAGAAGAADAEALIRPGFQMIESVAALRASLTNSGQRIRMRPGVYRVTDAEPDRMTIFAVSGSDNVFDLRGVTLEVESKVQAGLRGPVHALAGYRVTGSRLRFEGGRFETLGDLPPHTCLSTFVVLGDDIVFSNSCFIIRGSAPYGYGDLFGKGAGAAVRLRKHSGMMIGGDRVLVVDCRFLIQAFGHGIHIHGAQDTVVRRTTIEGELRLTDTLYEQQDGLAARFAYRRRFPPWLAGEPIPKGRMLSLAEDGIRAYLEGRRDGVVRRTGHILVEDCVVRRMRGGITLALAERATVTGSHVTESGYPGHAYALPSESKVSDSRGDAAFAPLLVMPYSHKRNADLDLELLPHPAGMGDHALAEITGRGHRIRIRGPRTLEPGPARPIVIGRMEARWTVDNTPESDLARLLAARDIALENDTPHPVLLTPFSSGNMILTRGPVAGDAGSGNRIKAMEAIEWAKHEVRE